MLVPDPDLMYPDSKHFFSRCSIEFRKLEYFLVNRDFSLNVRPAFIPGIGTVVYVLSNFGFFGFGSARRINADPGCSE
jgi:hypothetical protein